MKCPRCLDKGYLDQTDLVRLYKTCIWGFTYCHYCEGNVISMTPEYVRDHSITRYRFREQCIGYYQVLCDYFFTKKKYNEKMQKTVSICHKSTISYLYSITEFKKKLKDHIEKSGSSSIPEDVYYRAMKMSQIDHLKFDMFVLYPEESVGTFWHEYSLI